MPNKKDDPKFTYYRCLGPQQFGLLLHNLDRADLLPKSKRKNDKFLLALSCCLWNWLSKPHVKLKMFLRDKNFTGLKLAKRSFRECLRQCVELGLAELQGHYFDRTAKRINALIRARGLKVPLRKDQTVNTKTRGSDLLYTLQGLALKARPEEIKDINLHEYVLEALEEKRRLDLKAIEERDLSGQQGGGEEGPNTPQPFQPGLPSPFQPQRGQGGEDHDKRNLKNQEQELTCTGTGKSQPKPGHLLRRQRVSATEAKRLLRTHGLRNLSRRMRELRAGYQFEWVERRSRTGRLAWYDTIRSGDVLDYIKTSKATAKLGKKS